MHVVAVVGATRYAGGIRGLQIVSDPLLAGTKGARSVPASAQRATAQPDAVARLQPCRAGRCAFADVAGVRVPAGLPGEYDRVDACEVPAPQRRGQRASRSEEHTSELQSPVHLVCCLLL